MKTLGSILALLFLAGPAFATAPVTTPPLVAVTPCESQNSVYENVGLVSFGLLLGALYYPLGVAVHEGAHAAAAVAHGAKVTEFSIVPETLNGNFTFGHMRYEGELTMAQENDVLLAPKTADLLILSAYADLMRAGALPESKVLQMALLVPALGAWVDFSKDVMSTNPHSDHNRIFTNWGANTEAKRAEYRAAQGVVATVTAIPLIMGAAKILAEPKVSLDTDVE